MWPLYGDLKVAQKLLEPGADVNARNNRGETPPQVALNGCDADGDKPPWVPKQGEGSKLHNCCCNMAQKARKDVASLAELWVVDASAKGNEVGPSTH